MGGIFYPQAMMTLRIVWEDFNLKTKANLQKVHVLQILAKRVTVHINDYTQADTFDAEIDYSDFPFDPRAIRACGVTVHMKDTKKLFEDTGTNNRVQIKPEVDLGSTMFIGFADEEGITLDDSNRVVRLEGRDLTSLLVDRPYLGGPIDTRQPLDKLIEKLLGELEETANLKVDNRVGEAFPVIGSFSPSGTSAPNLGAKRNTRGHDESYWDVIQGLASQAGLIAYIELDKLVLSKPRVLYGEKKAKVFVYGKNVSRLEFKRKIGRKKNFNVSVKSLNVETKEVLTALIPEEATADWSAETGVPLKRVQIPSVNADGSEGTPKDAPFIGLRVPNVNNKNQLIKIGQELYEEFGRQQIEGNLETKDMETHLNDNPNAPTCFDLLKLRVGMPLSVAIDQKDMEGIKKTSSRDEKLRFLKSKNYPNDVAIAMADVLSNNRFSTLFYTRAVQFSFSAESGISIKVDFLNFIEIPERYK